MKTAAVLQPRQEAAQAADPEKTGPERRRSPRHATLIGAFIALERGHGDMPCYILNVSDTGALLMPTDVLRCPSQFMLRPETGEQRKCEVVWTNGRMLAVRFLGEKVPPLTGGEWASLGSEPTFDLIGPRQRDDLRL